MDWIYTQKHQFPPWWIWKTQKTLNFHHGVLSVYAAKFVNHAVNFEIIVLSFETPRRILRLWCKVCRHDDGCSNSSAKFENTKVDDAIEVRSLKTSRWMMQLKCKVLKHRGECSNYDAKFENTMVHESIMVWTM